MMTALRAFVLAGVIPSIAVGQGYGNGSHGAFAPTVDVTLDTTPNGGVFQFTSVMIQSGVTVRLAGAHPAQILCLGAVTIAGTLSADGEGSRWVGGTFSNGQAGGPGGFAGGPGWQNGFGPGGGGAGLGLYPVIHGGSASHATVGATSNPFVLPAPTYGAALPFDLRGGSGGGGPGTGNFSSYGPPASGGGGTIVILAGGPVLVTGTVRARGGDIVMGPEYAWPNSRPGTGGNGSGGAILLRSLDCLTVAGTIDARGGIEETLQVSSSQHGGDGFVRLDGYSACALNLTGAVIRPAPFVAALPFLAQLEPPRIGQVYRVRCASAPGDVVGVYYSPGTAVIPVMPFGVLELDPALILMLGQFAVPATGHDPLAVIDVAVPMAPVLVGVTVHAQAFNAFGAVTGQARLSNRLVVTIGS